jgi:hypothetical protein
MNFKRSILIAIPLILCLSIAQAEMGRDTIPSTDSVMLPDSLISVDTTFTPDTTGGWNFQFSFLKAQGDSVLFEPVFSRIVPAINDWSQYSLVGRIPATFAPAVRQNIEYKEPTRTWSIILVPDGRCLLKLDEGPFPSGNPCVVQFQIRYKK